MYNHDTNRPGRPRPRSVSGYHRSRRKISSEWHRSTSLTTLKQSLLLFETLNSLNLLLYNYSYDVRLAKQRKEYQTNASSKVRVNSPQAASSMGLRTPSGQEHLPSPRAESCASDNHLHLSFDQYPQDCQNLLAPSIKSLV